MRPSAIVAEAYASGKIKLFEFLIDVTRIPVILQENYGFGYILQKMNFTFQLGEIHTILEYLLQEYEHGLYIPIWRDSYLLTRYGDLCYQTFTFQYGEIHTAVLPPFYA